MIALLQKKKDASVSMPADVEMRKPDNEEEYDSLHAAAEDLINAINSKNPKSVAEALRAAFEICESYEEPMGEEHV